MHIKNIAMLGLTLALLGLGPAWADEAASAVYVNGQPIGPKTQAMLASAYGEIAPGRYWYDSLSGLWGVEGRPAAGQIRAGLTLGGALRRDASRGNTGVIINGRELPLVEVQFLQQLFGVVLPGRYWLNAAGLGGYEGGPPVFDLMAAAQSSGYWSSHSDYGSVGGDGQGFTYFIDGDTSWSSGD